MAAAPCPAEALQSPTLPGARATNPASPAGIAQTVVTPLGPTLTATVDAAVHRGLEQLHLEVQAQAQRIAHVEDRISALEDDSTANSAVLGGVATS